MRARPHPTLITYGTRSRAARKPDRPIIGYQCKKLDVVIIISSYLSEP